MALTEDSSKIPNTFVQIVVVDDNDADAELIVRTLRQSRVSNPIVRLRNGEEALQFLIGDRVLLPRSWPRRVVLLDLDLPKLRGLDVLRELRKHRHTEKLPVVILTGSVDVKFRDAALALGVIRYENKPLSVEVVTDVIHSALDHWNNPARRS